MTNKRIQLPKEGYVQVGGTEEGTKSEFIDEGQDVQGHWFPTPAPPAEFSKRGSGQGGEAIPGDDETGDTKLQRPV